MVSISGTTSSAAILSPSDRLKQQLQSAVSAGTVKATDQTALSSALDDIDSAMKASGPPQQGGSPTGMKDKVDSLIDKQVADGKLTDEQAEELKTLFAEAAPQGAGGPGGPPPGPPPTDESSSTEATDGSSTTTSTDGTDATDQMIEALKTFLEKFEQAVSANSPYGSDGTSTGSGLSSLLFDGNA